MTEGTPGNPFISAVSRELEVIVRLAADPVLHDALVELPDDRVKRTAAIWESLKADAVVRRAGLAPDGETRLVPRWFEQVEDASGDERFRPADAHGFDAEPQDLSVCLSVGPPIKFGTSACLSVGS